MSNTRHVMTYMMFTKRGRGFSKIIGPFFEVEKDAIRKQHFLDKKTVYMIEETAFEARYPYKYREHIELNWMDKMFCYLQLNVSWIGKSYVSFGDGSITSDWFGLYAIYDEATDDVCHILNTSVDANPFFVARLRQDLLDLNLMPLKLGIIYYYDKEKRLFTRNNAISRSLAENLINGMSLS